MGSMFLSGEATGKQFLCSTLFQLGLRRLGESAETIFPGRSRSAGFCHMGSDVGVALRKIRIHILLACFVMCVLIVKRVLQASLTP